MTFLKTELVKDDLIDCVLESSFHATGLTGFPEGFLRENYPETFGNEPPALPEPLIEMVKIHYAAPADAFQSRRGLKDYLTQICKN